MVEDKMNKIKVGVLQGGVSSEREISLQSGAQVISSLQRSGIRTAAIDVTCRDSCAVREMVLKSGIDCAFIALHGEFGEDGRIQMILEDLKLPYTGSGPLASRIAMNKIESKKIFMDQGVPTPEFEVLVRGSRPSLRWQCPFVIKPDASGSSVGVSVVKEAKELDQALASAFRESETVLIEEYIEGKECTVGILAGKPMGVVEILPKTGYYDFSAKYSEGMASFKAPAEVEPELYRKIRDTGLRAHQVLGCRDFSRADIRLSAEGIPYVLEVNSIPGLTSHSLLPLSASCAGIDFDLLIKKMLELCLESRVLLKERTDIYHGTQR